MEAFKFNKYVIIEAVSIEMSIAEAKTVLKFIEGTVAYGSEERETREMLLKTLENGLGKKNEAELPSVSNYDENGVPF